MKTGRFSRRNVILASVSAAALPVGGWGQNREVEGGIGGTGIVGLLTDFGSLVVAGRTVKTDTDTAVLDAFGGLSENDLALGDSLTIEASTTADGLLARRVHLTQPLVGLITVVNGNTVTINGIEVTLETASPLTQTGQRVAASGLWRGQSVIASRLSPARSALDLVAGDVSRAGFRTLIGGVQVSGARLPQLAVGSYATAVGSYDQSTSRLIVQQVQAERFRASAGPLQRLIVEGFLEPISQAPGFRVSGLGHSFAQNLSLAEYSGSRVLFSGPYNGTFEADRALLLSENSAARRSLLRSLSSRDL